MMIVKMWPKNLILVVEMSSVNLILSSSLLKACLEIIILMSHDPTCNTKFYLYFGAIELFVIDYSKNFCFLNFTYNEIIQLKVLFENSYCIEFVKNSYLNRICKVFLLTNINRDCVNRRNIMKTIMMRLIYFYT